MIQPAVRCLILAGLVSLLVAPVSARADDKKPETHRVPYQITETKHILVRVKINGKGPFHFIVDTGAPALIMGTEAAKKAGITPEKNGWATFDKMEIEGGLMMEKVRARIEDPFQLIGMNKMNLPGIRYDGMMGYTVLAQFRIEYDFTQPHLVWTKLDWEPPFPKGLMELGGKMPSDLAAMGSLVQFAAALLGRVPDPVFVYRGFVGVQLVETGGGVVVEKVLTGSPAWDAGLKEGHHILKFADKPVKSLADLHKLAVDHPPGETIAIEVGVGDRFRKTIMVKTMKGL